MDTINIAGAIGGFAALLTAILTFIRQRKVDRITAKKADVESTFQTYRGLMEDLRHEIERLQDEVSECRASEDVYRIKLLDLEHQLRELRQNRGQRR